MSITPERQFGLLFSVVFLGVVYFAYASGLIILSGIFLAASCLLLGVTIFYPKTLAAPNKAWHQIGILMGTVINPIILGIIFFLMFTPVALVCRMVGRDELNIKGRGTASYWEPRIDNQPLNPESFKNQY